MNRQHVISIGAGLLIILLTFLAYVPALRAGWVWDDDDWIVRNPRLDDLDGLRRIWFEPGAVLQYYPLTYTTWWIDRHVWGDKPFGYHLENVALHALSAVLLWRILRRLGVPGTYVAALVLAVHPVHVESVAWATERKNVLFVAFYLGAMASYMRVALTCGAQERSHEATEPRSHGGEEPRSTGTGEMRNAKPLTCGGRFASQSGSAAPHIKGRCGMRNRWQSDARHHRVNKNLSASSWKWCQAGHYSVALGLFACAMLSKTMACSLPAVLALVLWWKRGRLSWRDWAGLAPFFAVGAGLGLLSATIERETLGAEGPDWELSLIERTLIAGRAVWFYAGKLVWPAKLTFVYPKWAIDAGDWRQFLYPAAAVGAIVVAWVVRWRWGRGPLVALLCFGGTLLPALGYFNVYYMRYSYVADHFQYVSSIALTTLVCAVLWRALAGRSMTAVAHVGHERRMRNAECETRNGPMSDVGCGMWDVRSAGEGSVRGNVYQWGLALVLVAVLGLLTYRQAGAYRDKETLYRDTIEKNPAAWLAHSGLGLELQKQGDYFGAARHYGESVRLRPDYDKVHYDWATALERIGEVERAQREYEEALRLNERHVEARMNLGLLYMRRGEREQGLRELWRAVEQAPDDVRALNNVGAALMEAGQLDAAERMLRQALRVDPTYELAQRNLGSVMAQRERH